MTTAEQLKVGDAFEPSGEEFAPDATAFDARTFSHQQPPPPPPAPRRGREPERYPFDEHYPFDPRLPPAMQQDLDKLRCVPDRALAQTLFEYWQALYPSWKSGEAAKWREQENRDRDDRDLERLKGLADRALKGEFGDEAKAAAQTILLVDGYKTQRRSDLPSLREFESELWKLRRG